MLTLGRSYLTLNCQRARGSIFIRDLATENIHTQQLGPPTRPPQRPTTHQPMCINRAEGRIWLLLCLVVLLLFLSFNGVDMWFEFEYLENIVLIHEHIFSILFVLTIEQVYNH